MSKKRHTAEQIIGKLREAILTEREKIKRVPMEVRRRLHRQAVAAYHQTKEPDALLS